jgi:hypothetical protein
MPILKDYDQFDGLHWETGSLRNYYAYHGITAPHTGEPYSEAMLLGISGGIVMGYFTFHYEGYDPYVRLLTRNTFDPLSRIYERLDIKSNVKQTASVEKGVKNLLDVLETGSPAIVFADMFSLPYNAAPQDEGIWGIFPILVYGYDENENIVWIADRSRVPLTVTLEELAIARGRTKKNKYRIMTHELPTDGKLISAVEEGIRECIQLFIQPPPKGSKNNFGFLAYEKWVKLLGKSSEKSSWDKMFPPGKMMYSGLTSAFTDICIFGKEGGAERDTYAQFLVEASELFSKPALTEVAEKFSSSAKAWNELANTILPDNINLFKQTKDLMLKRHNLFLDKGNVGLDEIRQIDDQLKEIKTQMSEDYPLGINGTDELKASIADKVLAIRDIEYDAIQDLQMAVE